MKKMLPLFVTALLLTQSIFCSKRKNTAVIPFNGNWDGIIMEKQIEGIVIEKNSATTYSSPGIIPGGESTSVNEIEFMYPTIWIEAKKRTDKILLLGGGLNKEELKIFQEKYPGFYNKIIRKTKENEYNGNFCEKITSFCERIKKPNEYTFLVTDNKKKTKSFTTDQFKNDKAFSLFFDRHPNGFLRNPGESNENLRERVALAIKAANRLASENN